MFQMYGVVPPMITPFRETGEVDFEGLHTLVDYLSGEVDGLFINGSYGAGVMMTEEERRAVTEKTIETAAGRVPVVAHIGTADSYSAARLAKHAAEVGAAAVASVGPFFQAQSGSDLRVLPENRRSRRWACAGICLQQRFLPGVYHGSENDPPAEGGSRCKRH